MASTSALYFNGSGGAPATMYTEFILNADGPYNAPADKLLVAIVLDPNADLAALKIGTSLGGEEIFPADAVAAATGKTIGVVQYNLVNTPIYFGGVTSPTTIRFYYL